MRQGCGKKKVFFATKTAGICEGFDKLEDLANKARQAPKETTRTSWMEVCLCDLLGGWESLLGTKISDLGKLGKIIIQSAKR